MTQLVQFLVNLSFFKVQPSQIPYSHTLLGLLLILNIAIEVASYVVEWTLPLGTLVAMNVASRLTILATFYALLAFKGIPERWVQMSSAWLGVNAVISLTAFALSLITGLLGSHTHTVIATLSSILVLALAFWLIRATAYILQMSMSVSKWLGITLAIALLITSGMVELNIAYWISPEAMTELELKAREALDTPSPTGTSTLQRS